MKYTHAFIITLLILLLGVTKNNAQNNHIPEFEEQRTIVNAVAYSPDGIYIATASNDSYVRLWRVSDGQRRKFFRGLTDAVTCVDFSPDGKLIAAGSKDNTIMVWNASTGEQLHHFKGHQAMVNDICFSPDGTQLLSASDDHTICLWNCSFWKNETIFKGHKAGVTTVMFLPDGYRFLSGSKDKTIRAWNTNSQRYTRVYNGHKHYVTDIDINFDGTSFVSASFDKSIKVWKLNTYAPYAEFTGHSYAVNAVKFSPDGTKIASASADNSIRIWDIATQTHLHTFWGHTKEVLDIDYNHNGKYIISCSFDKTFQVWNANPDIDNSTDNKPVVVTEMPKIWAVVVGVARYNHIGSLNFADDDAYQMYAFLKSPEGGALPDEQIEILVDEKATKDNIIRSMYKVYNKASNNDVIIFYFSGHGDDNAFLPHNYNGTSNQLTHDEIKTVFENSPAKNRICIADACHSGLLASRSNETHNSIANYYKAIDDTQGGIALLMSSKAEENSIEYKGLRQGVFSFYLIQGLKGKADENEDTIITIQELYDYVEREVKIYTGNYQNPILTGNYDKKMPLSAVR